MGVKDMLTVDYPKDVYRKRRKHNVVRTKCEKITSSRFSGKNVFKLEGSQAQSNPNRK